MLKERFKKYKSDIGLGGSKKFDMDLYLSESVIKEEGEFDILRWWKLNSKRFPLISRMARDILTIPISTVASEYASSTRGWILDVFRSSLTPKIVEVLICAQYWIKLGRFQSVEEAIDDLEDFEKGKCFIVLF